MEANHRVDRKKLDLTVSLTFMESKRRLDSMARVANGSNICTAVCFYNKEFLISNNTGEEDLIRQYMTFFWNYFQEDDFSEDEKIRLLRLSLEGEQKTLKDNLLSDIESSKTLTEDQIAKQKEIEENSRLAEERLHQNHKKWTSYQSKLDELQNSNEKISNLTQENKEKAKLLDLKREKLAEKDIKQETAEMIKAEAQLLIRQMKDIQNQLKKFPINDEFEKSWEEMKRCENNIKALRFELERCDKNKKNLAKDASLETINRTIERKRGSKFESKLRKAMNKIMNWIDEKPPEFSENMTPNFYRFVHYLPKEILNYKATVHAEMNIVQEIFEMKKLQNDENDKKIYIGIRKLCCLKCYLVLDEINKIKKMLLPSYELFKYFETRGSHKKYYGQWGEPPFYQSIPEEIRNRISESMIVYFKKKDAVTDDDYMSSASEPEVKTKKKSNKKPKKKDVPNKLFGFHY